MTQAERELLVLIADMLLSRVCRRCGKTNVFGKNLLGRDNADVGKVQTTHENSFAIHRTNRITAT